MFNKWAIWFLWAVCCNTLIFCDSVVNWTTTYADYFLFFILFLTSSPLPHLPCFQDQLHPGDQDGRCILPRGFPAGMKGCHLLKASILSVIALWINLWSTSVITITITHTLSLTIKALPFDIMFYWFIIHFTHDLWTSLLGLIEFHFVLTYIHL